MLDKLDNSSLEHKIAKLSFQVLSSTQIESLSVATIDCKTLYDIESRRPFSGGPLDLRLGVSTKTGTCSTCRESIQNCAGHFGQVKLVLPCYHIGFLKHTIAILNCICKKCASLLIGFTRKLAYSNGRTSLESIKNLCRNVKVCPKCMAPNGVVKKNTGFRIYNEIKGPKGDVTVTEINPLTCLNLFGLISEDDYELLGMKETPSNLIIQSILVPPSCIRPSVDMQDEGFNEDDITVKLSEIINTNKLLEESIRKGNSLPIINDDWDYLQLQVNLLINSDLPSVNITSTPIRGIVQRLKGKGGRFRCNLSGKRVDFSGRTVISPDPNLSVEEVGVPVHIAKILTVPEKVNNINIRFLEKLVANGVGKWPGANFLITRDEKGKEFKRFLMYAKNKDLRIGDVVERHLLDGDIVLFNRQPSLHRMSIMAHKARIHGNRTLRFNECVCAPYNADFDGDEMNIHLPQTYEARAEAEELMGVKHNICTIRNGEPLVSCTQDFLTGAYLLTAKGVFLTRSRFSQLCAYATGRKFSRIKVAPAIISPVELFTGKQVFEFVIEYSLSFRDSPLNSSNSNFSSNPNSVNSNFNSNINTHLNNNQLISLKAKNRSFKEEKDINDAYVEILNNRFIRGRLDKAIIGGENRKGSLIYQLLKAGKICAVTVMNSISSLTSRYLAERGFSIGLDDVFPSKNLLKEKVSVIRKVYSEVDEIIAKSKTDEILEGNIGVLNQIREECGSICIRELGGGNAPIIMQTCGSKGSKINVAQMIACVGQQIISDKRIQDGMINRTLPHFPFGSKSPESKGFVLNSFFSGLTSYEFFFHAVSGREGLVDTAVKTAETGYMQRRLMKALEDQCVKYDHTVRNSGEDVVQYCYGEDGMDTLRDEGNEFLEWVFISAVSLFNHEGVNGNLRSNSLNGHLTSHLASNTPLTGHLASNTPLTSHLASNPLSNNNLTSPLTGFNISEYVNNYFNNTKTEDNKYFISDSIDTVLDRISSNQMTSGMINCKFKKDLVDFLRIAESREFQHSGGIFRYFQNREFIKRFFSSVSTSLWHKAVDPGTPVGIAAGQSIGEPGTQMTLKTFHFSGVANMNVTLGVPRLNEIINGSSNISTPIINARLVAKDMNEAIGVKRRVEKLLFKDVVEKVTQIIGPERTTVEFTRRRDWSTGAEGGVNSGNNPGPVSSPRPVSVPVDMNEIGTDKIVEILLNSNKGCNIEVEGDKIVYVTKRVKENTSFHIEKMKKQILHTKIWGIEGVNRGIVNWTSEGYELLIEGKCFGKILGMWGVDPYGTMTNDIMEVERTLGIEAGRAMIVREIEYTMGKYGITVDHRHRMLVADTMTSKGTILGITRFGIGKMKGSTLMLASFEQTADYLFNAAVRGTEETIEGVSESIILGIPISLGTGSMELYWKGD